MEYFRNLRHKKLFPDNEKNSVKMENVLPVFQLISAFYFIVLIIFFIELIYYKVRLIIRKCNFINLTRPIYFLRAIADR